MKRKKNSLFKNKFNKINIWLYIVIAFVLISIYPFYRHFIYCYTDSYREEVYSHSLSLLDDYVQLLKESHEIFKNDKNDLRWYVYNANYRHNVFFKYDYIDIFYLPSYYSLDEIKSFNYPVNLYEIKNVDHEVLVNDYIYYEYFYDIFSNEIVDYEKLANKILLNEAEELVSLKREDVLNIVFDEEKLSYVIEFITIILILIYLFNLKFIDYKKEFKSIFMLFIIIFILNLIYDVISLLMKSGSCVIDLNFFFYIGNIGYIGFFNYILVIFIVYGIKLLLNIKLIKNLKSKKY